LSMMAAAVLSGPVTVTAPEPVIPTVVAPVRTRAPEPSKDQ